VKKQRGRPKRKDGEGRVEQFRVLLTKDEYALLVKLSYSSGKSMSEIIRDGIKMQEYLY
jgi:hypothetical protein